MSPRQGTRGVLDLIDRGLAGRRFSRGLLALPPGPGTADRVGSVFDRIDVFHQDYGVFRRETETGRIRHRFGPLWPEPGTHDAAVVHFPKDKGRAGLVLGILPGWLATGAPVFVVGPNRGGIRSATPLVEERIGPVVQRRSARHCLLLEARRERDPVAAGDRREFETEVWGRRLRVVSHPGVFSHGRLDAGTRFLLETWRPEPDARRVLDWGSGCGVIGAAVSRELPGARVDLVDTDALAVAASRETLASNGLDPERARPGDGIPDGNGEPFDLIVSNPPFHAGVDTSRDAVRGMIREAHRRLAPEGRMVLVTNQFLVYRRELEEFVGGVRTVAEDGRYRVTEARSPRAGKQKMK